MSYGYRAKFNTENAVKASLTDDGPAAPDPTVNPEDSTATKDGGAGGPDFPAGSSAPAPEAPGGDQ